MLKSIFLLLIFSATAVAAPMYERLEKKNYHYSALHYFLKDTSKRLIAPKDLIALERIVLATGVEVLEDFDAKTLSKYPTPSAYFVLARKAFLAKDHTTAMAQAKKIPDGHKLFPEAHLIKAQIYAAQNNLAGERASYKICAAKAKSKITSKKERYFRVVSEICTTNLSRSYSKEGKYKESLDLLNRMSKDTYKWPYLLYERAWLYYHQADYNRALGLLVTYKAPLLDTYFFPEAEYLTALNYFKLCLWSDSSLIIKQYYESYRPRFTALEKVLRENKNTKHYFFKMLFVREQELKQHEKFVHAYVILMKKQNRFAAGIEQIKRMNKEIEQISKRENKGVNKLLTSHIRDMRLNILTKIDNQAKVDIFSFLESVRFFSYELFKLNLEIITRKKNLLYEDKQLVANRGRGDHSDVQKSPFEYFWTFDGPFWADELGDYSFGLKSNCKIVPRETKK